MNALVLRYLLKYCRKHEIDSQEIDSEINYAENRSHLETLGGKSEAQLMREYQSQYDQYRHEHILEDYVMAIMEGKTKSEQTVSLDSRFSLSEWVKRHFWGEKMYKIEYKKDRNSETNFLILSNGKVVMEEISETKKELTEAELQGSDIIFRQGQTYRTLPDYVLYSILENGKSGYPSIVEAFRKRYVISI